MKLLGRHSSTAVAPGFTLIELMLAVAILGLIMVMLAGSFHAVATGKLQGENRLVTAQEGRSVIWQMSNEIRGAVYTGANTQASQVILIGQGRMENNSPIDSIAFSTLDPGHRRSLEGFGAEDTITYATAPNPNHRGWFILTRTQVSSLLTDGGGLNNANATVVVADNLLWLHFRYFDGNIWGESWNSQSLPPGRQLPQAVGIELGLASPRGAPSRLSTMVTLPMAFAQW
jgi:prepilin-type N-terminal cleavage/methylation domain-containing protein